MAHRCPATPVHDLALPSVVTHNSAPIGAASAPSSGEFAAVGQLVLGTGGRLADHWPRSLQIASPSGRIRQMHCDAIARRPGLPARHNPRKLLTGKTGMPHDQMFRCEQKKEFRTADGGSEWRWGGVAASAVAGVPRDRIRCIHCHGAVRLHCQQVEHGPQDHLEHLHRQDSEHCRGGHYFTGGEHRMSRQPVD